MDETKHNRSEIAAYEEGREARMKGKARTSVPNGYRAAKSLRKAFESGWDDGIVTPEPVVTIREPEITTRGDDGVKRLPAGEPLPEYYQPPKAAQPVPCRECRAVRMADTGQAVILWSRGHGMAYFYCKVCKARFKMRVQ